MDANKVYSTNSCGDFTITRYVNANEVYIKFLDTGFVTKTKMTQIVRGCIKDKLKPSVHGVGILGDETIRDCRGELFKEYVVWAGVLGRCCNTMFKQKRTTYKYCTISDNFKSYKYFREWCNKQIGFGNEGWHLDKDILVKCNKVYGETTCCFVPHDINTLFVKCDAKRGKYPIGVYFETARNRYTAKLKRYGVSVLLGRFATPEEAFYSYKEAKEAYIKEVADKWKGIIDARVYEALVNYEVGIDD